ncbi:acyltransferase family protein [Actinacidiphila epipremni]|uniref:Acyltransferase n=1 Tax=Actinacidiphila epipremni TaxID=2053013 RepID=A0ABX0ZYH2_9ACTN|nr:acyltransferase [Actinacidiphila epipremni]NJP47334.1 acyltransferase [Actinacidiphila epipremni]
MTTVISPEERPAADPPAAAATATARTAVPPSAAAAKGAGSTRPARLDSLTGLRWLAALGVFLNHTATLLPVPHTREVFLLGSSGVTFFFVLSGFVLTWTRTSDDGPAAFYARRLGRIWPLLIIGAIVPLILMKPDAFPGQDDVMVGAAGAAILFYQAWVPKDILGGASPVTWSLSCEAFFYALFPFLAGFTLRRSLRWLAVAAVVLVAVGWGIRIWMWQEYPPPAHPNFNANMNTLTFWVYSPIARVWEFLLGVVAAAAVRAGWRPRIPPVLATALLAVGLFVLWELRDQKFRVAVPYDALSQVTAPLYALLVVSLAVRQLDGGRRSWLSTRPMVMLGEWSFAFYLIHFTVLFEIAKHVTHRNNILKFYMQPVTPASGNLGWVLLGLGIAVVVATLLFMVVERPIERYVRHKVSPQRGRLATDVPIRAGAVR